MSESPVVTRFAPSPTGHLHVGGARTALLNWAYARGRGGKFLLRIEDTDQTRSTEAAERAILHDLRWLGLDWDNAGAEPRQSKRLDKYETALQTLRDAGRAYDDDGAVRFKMPDHDVVVTDQVLGNVTVPAGQTEDFVIRKRDGYPTYHFAVVVDDADMGVTHVIRGQEHLSNAPKHVALQEALGLPTPTYAHIPLIFNPDGSKMSKRDKAKAARREATSRKLSEDKGAMNRLVELDKLPTDDLPAAMQRHRFLFQREHDFFSHDDIQAFILGDTDRVAIAEAIADYYGIHLPEIDVQDFRVNGYFPEVLCNYLALLGWNPGNDLEKFDNQFLCERFDFDRVGRKNAKFDREKLLAFNGDAIRVMSVDEFAARWRTWCGEFRPDFSQTLDASDFHKLAEAYHQRTRVFSEVCEMAGFFVGDVAGYDDKAVKKNLLKNDGEGLKYLRAFRDELASLDPFTGEAAHALIKTYSEREDVGMGKVAQPLRVAVSGGAVTPPIDLTLDILGRDTTLRRIDACLEAFAEHV